MVKTHVEIIGTNTKESSFTVMVVCEKQRYLFNCGEGTQRFSTEHRLRIGKLHSLFLTRICPHHTLGGLAGMLLTLADMGLKCLDVVSPNAGMAVWLRATRSFNIRPNFTTNIGEIEVKNGANNSGIVALFHKNIYENLANTNIHSNSNSNSGSGDIDSKSKNNKDETKKKKKSGSKISGDFGLSMKIEAAVKEGLAAKVLQDDNITVLAVPLLGVSTVNYLAGLRIASQSSAAAAAASNDNNNNNNNNNNDNDSDSSRSNSNHDDKGNTVEDDNNHVKKRKKQKIHTTSNIADNNNNNNNNSNNPVNHRQHLIHQLHAPFDDLSICYIVKPPNQLGKFDNAKAEELGFFGKDKGRLRAGEALVSPKTGKLIQPSEIIADEITSAAILIIDCPTHHHAQSLFSNKFLNSDILKDLNVKFVLHSTSDEIFNSDTYKNWMQSAAATCRHIVANDKMSTNDSFHVSQAVNLVKFQMLDNKIFSFSKPTLTPDDKDGDGDGDDNEDNNNANGEKKIIGAAPLQRIHLSPANIVGIDETASKALLLNRSKIHKETKFQNPAYFEKVCEYQQQQQDDKLANITISNDSEDSKKKSVNDGAEILFLGTGCAIPSKYRNVSAAFLRCNSTGGGILIDCGEGTLSQLYRKYGNEKGEELIRNLTAVWISHHHADHHCGLSGILKHRAELDVKKPLLIIGPNFLTEWLSTCKSLSPSILYQFIRNSEILHSNPILNIKNNGELAHLKEDGIEKIETVNVIHCRQAYALCITLADTRKLVFSGDTVVCKDLIKAGEGAFLLVHEATFEDALEDQANEKKHSTLSQAVSVAKDMKAKYTLLNHFSQRYPKFPNLNTIPSNNNNNDGNNSVNNILYAFDLMSVELVPSELNRLTSLMPMIQLLFPDNEEEDKDVVDDDDDDDGNDGNDDGDKSKNNNNKNNKNKK